MTDINTRYHRWYAKHGEEPVLVYPSIVAKMMNRNLPVIDGNSFIDAYQNYRPLIYPDVINNLSDEQVYQFGCVLRFKNLHNRRGDPIRKMKKQIIDFLKQYRMFYDDDPYYIIQKMKFQLNYYKNENNITSEHFYVNDIPYFGGQHYFLDQRNPPDNQVQEVDRVQTDEEFVNFLNQE